MSKNKFNTSGKNQSFNQISKAKLNMNLNTMLELNSWTGFGNVPFFAFLTNLCWSNYSLVKILQANYSLYKSSVNAHAVNGVIYSSLSSFQLFLAAIHIRRKNTFAQSKVDAIGKIFNKHFPRLTQTNKCIALISLYCTICSQSISIHPSKQFFRCPHPNLCVEIWSVEICGHFSIFAY
jgi:hypothetical protein